MTQDHRSIAIVQRGRRGRGRRGNATLETALVLMLVLLPLTFGAIEYSYVMYVRSTLQSAARETVRKGVIPGTRPAAAEAAGKMLLAKAFKLDEDSFSFSWDGQPGSDSEYITCTVTAPAWQTFGIRPLGSMPLASAVAPSAAKRFTASATMRQE